MENLNSALIGYSGFVGETLLRQTTFVDHYRSTNIGEIANREYDLVVCAGAPAQKWIANREPERDRQNLDKLIELLRTVRCGRFVLISTVDVFKHPVGVCEDTEVDEDGLHAYGLHRRMLEKFVQDQFADHLIARLPGLVGPALRKNVIYDLLHDNNISSIDARGIFQFYPMVNLWTDLQIGTNAGLKLLHLTAEPISISDIASQGFGRTFENQLANVPAVYDFRTKHASLFGTKGDYQYSKRDTLLAVRSYAQSEARQKCGEAEDRP